MSRIAIPQLLIREARRLLNLEVEGDNFPYVTVRGLLLFLLTSGLVLLTVPRERGLGITAYTRGPGRPKYARTKGTSYRWEGDARTRMRFRERIARLQRKGILELAQNEQGAVQLRLTQKGSQYIQRYILNNLEHCLPKQEHWDGLWRLVIFDIPERNRIARNAFRQTLEYLGFRRLQKSVFVYPYPCFAELTPLIDYFSVRPFVTLVETKSLGWQDRAARKAFGITGIIGIT